MTMSTCSLDQSTHHLSRVVCRFSQSVVHAQRPPLLAGSISCSLLASSLQWRVCQPSSNALHQWKINGTNPAVEMQSLHFSENWKEMKMNRQSSCPPYHSISLKGLSTKRDCTTFTSPSLHSAKVCILMETGFKELFMPSTHFPPLDFKKTTDEEDRERESFCLWLVN